MSTPELLMLAPMRGIVAEMLAPHTILHKLWEQPDRDSFLAQVGPRIRGLVASISDARIEASLFDRLPALEIVSSFGVGYDHIDLAAATARGIVVTNTPGVLDEEVADLAVGLLLATLRRLPQADRFVRDGAWPREKFPLSPTLRGRTVGILGLGNIGKAIARRLEGFGVAIAYHGRHAQEGVAYAYHPTLVGLAEAVDTLIAIVPGGPASHHIIDADVLRALGSQGVLINVARGSVVDEDALIAALQHGVILSAGLDVYADEPNVPQALIDLPNVVLLPHVGSATDATRDAMGKLVADNLLSWFAEGRALTPVAMR